MPLSHLGQTRSARRQDHLLQTPDTFVRAPLPGMQRATAIVHTGPALGASFTQYTAELEPEGRLGEARGQRFIYVLEGKISIDETNLASGGYAFTPEADNRAVKASSASRLAVIEKPYQPIGAGAPAFFTGREFDVLAERISEDDSLLMRMLIPNHVAHDFAVNTMTYQPGASLRMWKSTSWNTAC